MKLFFAVLFAIVLSSPAHALEIFEILGVDADPVLRHSELYGYARPFSAEAHVSIQCPTNCPSRTSVIVCAASAGWFRTDVDLTRTTVPNLTGTMFEGRKNAAEVLDMKRSVMIWRPDRNMQYNIVPDRKGYSEQPGTMKPGEKFEVPGPLQVVKKIEQGTEVIDGHPCRKVLRSIIRYEGAKPLDVTAWEATDLNGFCVQLQYEDKPLFCEDNPCVITILFKTVSFTPDPTLFEVPKDYRKYDDPLELLMPSTPK